MLRVAVQYTRLFDLMRRKKRPSIHRQIDLDDRAKIIANLERFDVATFQAIRSQSNDDTSIVAEMWLTRQRILKTSSEFKCCHIYLLLCKSIQVQGNYWAHSSECYEKWWIHLGALCFSHVPCVLEAWKKAMARLTYVQCVDNSNYMLWHRARALHIVTYSLKKTLNEFCFRFLFEMMFFFFFFFFFYLIVRLLVYYSQTDQVFA